MPIVNYAICVGKINNRFYLIVALLLIICNIFYIFYALHPIITLGNLN